MQVVKQNINNSLDIPAAFKKMTGVLVGETKKPMFDLYKRPPEVSCIDFIRNFSNGESQITKNTPDKKREKQYDKALAKSYKVR